METMDSSKFEVPKKKGGATLEEMFDRIQIVGRENEDQTSEKSLDEEDDDSDIDLNQSMFIEDGKISQKHQKYTELEARDKNDMDFPDEVDTPLDQEARKRFLLYRGIKSIKNCNWDPYENLPQEYAKIWRFQNYH